MDLIEIKKCISDFGEKYKISDEINELASILV